MKIAITAKASLKDPDKIVRKAVQYLRKSGSSVDLCPNACQLVVHENPKLDFHNSYDLIIVFGGDGSLLRTVQLMRNFEAAILPLNMGRLGFLSEGAGKNYKAILSRVLKGKYEIDRRILLRCSVMRGTRRAFSQRALNEVTIARDALARMVRLKTTVDDLRLTTYVADGLIVATPTGSTGYSLSAGGPVVSPHLDSIILTPIAPHSFTQKPIVLPPGIRVKVHISTSQDRVNLTVDGQTGFHLKDDDIVKVKRSSKVLKLVRMGGSTYFRTLRNKLLWGGDLVGRSS
ncbi:MAG: NAD(+)/NADH kinase [bacterium]|nr:NAD(+)/NADH kinase [bacterium]